MKFKYCVMTQLGTLMRFKLTPDNHPLGYTARALIVHMIYLYNGVSWNVSLTVNLHVEVLGTSICNTTNRPKVNNTWLTTFKPR